MAKVGPIQPQISYRPSGRARRRSDQASFDQALDQLLQTPSKIAPKPAGIQDGTLVQPGEVRFSRHATARLESRGITVSAPEMEQLADAVDQLDARGARESLVILGENAFVVGVPKRTVITAMPRAEALGNVFTNIDSTFVAS